MPGWWKKTLNSLSGGPRKKAGEAPAPGQQAEPHPPRAEPAPPDARDGLTSDEMRDMAEREYPLLHDDQERLARMVATDIKRSLRDERRRAEEGGGQAPDKRPRR